MKIAYYMPFKSLGHRNPSGDLVIGSELFDYLAKNGVDIHLASRFRCRWIYLKPHLWPLLLVELFRVVWACYKTRPDIWLTYHSYYKAPDIIGPLCCRLLKIPYVIFQGIYSTKRRKKLKTRAGFYLNRLALQQARTVFTNKKADHANLVRLLPAEGVVYTPPGLHPEEFYFEPEQRRRIRQELGVEDRVVVMTAAMFRPGVKTRGIIQVIRCCSMLMEQRPQCGDKVVLLIAGDGAEKERIREKAARELGARAILTGRLSRQDMRRYYSAADIFAFPGFEESLGMVYLEAQACRLPVVACGEWGAREAVVAGETGLLSPTWDEQVFVDHLEKLLSNDQLRQQMGRAAERHVGLVHDIERNYTRMLAHLEEIAVKV